MIELAESIAFQINFSSQFVKDEIALQDMKYVLPEKHYFVYAANAIVIAKKHKQKLRDILKDNYRTEKEKAIILAIQKLWDEKKFYFYIENHNYTENNEPRWSNKIIFSKLKQTTNKFSINNIEVREV